MLAKTSVVMKLNILFSLYIALLVACVWMGTIVFTSVESQAALAVGGAVLAALGLVMRISIRQGITRSMRAASVFIGKVAEGDLTARVGVTAYGETQKVLTGLEQMAGDLRTLVGEVARGARSVADTSAQIAQGNLDLSQRTEEQASTLEETASSMEELTSTVAHNADHARQASKLAGEASDSARRGEDAVTEVVATMDGILDSSRKMADIIGVIDGIAFQTNILALNAAVEAARAGEQGRGFAVVAAEVRSLAHRAAASAKEIKGLIADSQQRVQAGSNSVDAAGHTMVEVNLSVQKVSQLIAEIAAASQEQSAGIGQVNTAVTQMERVVQQNASLVEQASAATESMKEQAAGLLQLVSRFKVNEAAAAAPAFTPLHPARSPARPAAPTPAPIRVRSATTALPPASGGASQPRAARPGSGEWEEF